MREYRRTHPAQTVAGARRYRQTHADRETSRKREYRLTHPGKIAASDKKYRLAHIADRAAYNRAYSLANRDKNRSKAARHKARKLKASGYDYTTTEMVHARWEMFGNLCYLCGDRAEQTDHVKPLARGGAHWPCNLRPICKKCNAGKRDKWPYLGATPGGTRETCAMTVEVLP